MKSRDFLKLASLSMTSLARAARASGTWKEAVGSYQACATFADAQVIDRLKRWLPKAQASPAPDIKRRRK